MAASSESGKGDGGWWWSEVTSLASSVQRKGGSGERGIVEEEGIVGVGSWLGSYGFVFDILKAVSLLCFLSLSLCFLSLKFSFLSVCLVSLSLSLLGLCV